MMRSRAAVVAGKTVGALSRLTRRGGGTTFPGDVARAIDPGVLTRLAAELGSGSVVVTGTNGKTTTARLIAEALAALPARVVANRAGANMIYGATAAALGAAGWGGGLKADFGVFEVDEAVLPQAVDEIRPRVVVVGNLFRDQLDRYGELEQLALTIQRALGRLPLSAQAVLNADDPRVAQIGLGLDRPPLWYGLDDASVSAPELPHAADARTCPRCGRGLAFSAVYVGHNGHWRCPGGDFERPTPQITATSIVRHGLESLELQIGGQSFALPLGGLYNAYNLTAAVAALSQLGIDPARARASLARAQPAFGRQERFSQGGRSFTLLLAKNPTGFNEILREAAGAQEGRFLIALNDRVADGTDVSWIWDVDFEILASRPEAVIPAGRRGRDLALRMKYAGVACEPAQDSLERALDRLLEVTPPGSQGYILLTYTALLEMHRVLVKRGWLRPFWAS
ncbi:MAG TPA: MurT ligase domain-containing protein [Candidatus Nitrosotalea sp.]|nr:MurT ligase domain-containing protein [Candidatus Nitrosotalea sp.]